MSFDKTSIRVLCTMGLAGVMHDLAPRFERDSGFALDTTFKPANMLVRDIAEGAAFDVVLLTAALIDAEEKRGSVVAGTRLDVARSCVGVTVAPGAPLPDLTTVEAFKRTLLAARSIIFTAQGASGQYFASLLPRLGIEKEVRAKATIPDGGLVAERVISGEIELGVQQVSEILAVPGAVLAGQIPPEVQNYTTFSAALGAKAQNVAGAKALLARLGDAETAALARSKGMET
jgi:molybdate transport system substrate-binding protein